MIWAKRWTLHGKLCLAADILQTLLWCTVALKCTLQNPCRGKVETAVQLPVSWDTGLPAEMHSGVRLGQFEIWKRRLRFLLFPQCRERWAHRVQLSVGGLRVSATVILHKQVGESCKISCCRIEEGAGCSAGGGSDGRGVVQTPPVPPALHHLCPCSWWRQK